MSRTCSVAPENHIIPKIAMQIIPMTLTAGYSANNERANKDNPVENNAPPLVVIIRKKTPVAKPYLSILIFSGGLFLELYSPKQYVVSIAAIVE